jgi:hypothetical protein
MYLTMPCFKNGYGVAGKGHGGLSRCAHEWIVSYATIWYVHTKIEEFGEDGENEELLMKDTFL